MRLSRLKNTALTELFQLLRLLPSGSDIGSFAAEISPGVAISLRPYIELLASDAREVSTSNYSDFCRNFLRLWIERHDPPIFRSAHFGRRIILAAIDADMHDILRHAGLLSELDVASPAFEWWRDIGRVAQERAVPKDDVNRSAIGLSGELEVLRIEEALCRGLEISCRPQLSSLEDSMLGWDIESYRNISGVVQPVYLEVKTASHLDHVFLTWREAQKCRILPNRWMLVLVEPKQNLVSYYSADFVMELLPETKVEGVRWSECLLPIKLFSAAVCIQSEALG